MAERVKYTSEEKREITQRFTEMVKRCDELIKEFVDRDRKYAREYFRNNRIYLDIDENGVNGWNTYGGGKEYGYDTIMKVGNRYWITKNEFNKLAADYASMEYYADGDRLFYTIKKYLGYEE